VYGGGYSYRPDRPRLNRTTDRTILTAIYARMAQDATAITINHVRLDENDRFDAVLDSGLNSCLNLSANKDQTGRALRYDIYLSLLDEGVIAIVPVDIDEDPVTGETEIRSMRVGKVKEWYPDDVRVELYNDRTGQKEEVILPKERAAIVENPFYSVMNEPNSTVQRLIRKLRIMDAVDEQAGSGKLDLIIQLPYTVKSPARKEQAQERRKTLEEQLAGSLTAAEKSILGRCTELLYKPYLDRGCTGTPPTLKDFYRLLKMQPETEAQGLALSSELFITGTLNTFARHTNVNTRARIIDYDIRELGEQLMPLGMLVTLDAIYNRVIQNWKAGRRTWIVCDEFYLLFRYEYSSNFFYKLWKRIRKYNGLITGLTQNVDELLRSDTARLMLANSEFLIMLNQSATDRGELAKLLNISDTQLGYITNVPAGCGLIRCAGNLVPFTNSFPTDTKLYRLMTTKPDERLKE